MYVFFFNSLIFPVQSAFVLHLRQSNKLYISGQAFGHDEQQQTVTVATVLPRAEEPKSMFQSLEKISGGAQ